MLMLDYFAYGSNMLRARLEARVGAVIVIGAALLHDYAHAFNKRGRDGTGKGNISPAPGQMVHGVLYRLERAQFERLAQFEGGYRRVELNVRQREQALYAHSFQALAPVTFLRPTAEYVDYYVAGMREHDLPEDYQQRVLAQAQISGR